MYPNQYSSIASNDPLTEKSAQFKRSVVRKLYSLCKVISLSNNQASSISTFEGSV